MKRETRPRVSWTRGLPPKNGIASPSESGGFCPTVSVSAAAAASTPQEKAVCPCGTAVLPQPAAAPHEKAVCPGGIACGRERLPPCSGAGSGAASSTRTATTPNIARASSPSGSAGAGATRAAARAAAGIRTQKSARLRNLAAVHREQSRSTQIYCPPCLSSAAKLPGVQVLRRRGGGSTVVARRLVDAAGGPGGTGQAHGAGALGRRGLRRVGCPIRRRPIRAMRSFDRIVATCGPRGGPPAIG